MEFILIDEGRLKVALSSQELSAFGISAGTLDYTSPETRRMMKEILSRAELELGFVCNDRHTLCQVYTSKKGDCEIFITRLDTNDSEGSVHYRALYNKAEELSGRGMFGFDQLEWLLSVCRRLCDVGYSGKSSAYIGDDRRFYLLLDGLYSPEYSPIDEYSFICEYGESENILATTEYLFEHGKQICGEKAVETLSTL